VTTDHFSSRAPDASRTSAASRGQFYFAWGCFRDFVFGLRGVPPKRVARRMGGANGSRECAPDDKLRDTHQFEFTEMMGFAKGSTHPTSYEPRDRALRSCFASRASEISRPGRDKTTRRANHPKPVQPSAQKYFAFAVGQITDLTSPVSPDERGGSRSSRTCGGMRWTRELRLTSVTRADGEAVWS
jgi:hypothetical protein